MLKEDRDDYEFTNSIHHFKSDYVLESSDIGTIRDCYTALFEIEGSDIAMFGIYCNRDFDNIVKCRWLTFNNKNMDRQV